MVCVPRGSQRELEGSSSVGKGKTTLQVAPPTGPVKSKKTGTAFVDCKVLDRGQVPIGRNRKA